ncbi:MAG TPA: alkaline phosphatase family protein [Acidimicrobiales bacterium]|nr:alkaline phosphatase family protein [Acidimicrobiales bacterium]
MVAHPVPAPPEPVRPDFGGRCLTEVCPTLLTGVYGARGWVPPAWVPEPLHGARQVVLLVLDGLGARQLAARHGTAPVLAGGVGTTVTSVAPSTTAAALTSLTTGRPPAAHGVVGYRVAVGDQILNVLSWRLGSGLDARRLVAPHGFQPLPPFPGALAATPVVSRHDYCATGFTAAHLGDAPLHGWHTPAGLVVEVGRLLRGGARFVYAYYDGIDRTAHASGLGEHYDAELHAVDRMVGDLLEELPPGAALAVTADHGQVEVGSSIEVLGCEVMSLVTLLSGEGRFRWLHARRGAEGDLLSLCAERHGDVAWVRATDQLVDEGWLGGVPDAEIRGRLGDVALVPFAPTAFLDPADTGEQRLVCRHGSLTPDEMLVPLLAWAPRP